MNLELTSREKEVAHKLGIDLGRLQGFERNLQKLLKEIKSLEKASEKKDKQIEKLMKRKKKLKNKSVYENLIPGKPKSPYANTFHLTRILRYLEENENATKNQLRFILMIGPSPIKYAMEFLVKYKLVEETKPRGTSCYNLKYKGEVKKR